MNPPGIWFLSQQHWSVPRYVTLWQKMLPTLAVGFPLTVLTISEEYSGSLEADMSENHPTSSSVKWDVLLSLCIILSWMQSPGRSNVQVASVSWERLLWNQITSCTFTSTYCGTFMNDPGIWFPSQQHWSVPTYVALWQKMLPTLAVGFPLTVLTISEEYSGSLEADMSENHPTSSSVKWDVLLSLCVILSLMQSAGRSNVQVASVSWERLLWNQITSCTFTNTYRRTFMNHPGIWFPSQQHWFVPRHVTMWQKILVILPATSPLTLFTTSVEYSGSLEADMSENHPTYSSVKWEVLPFLVYNPFFDAIRRAQQRAGCKCFMEKAALKPDHKLHLYKHVPANIHESPWHMIPIPVALVCPWTYVALWQKILLTSPVTFPLTVLTTSEEYSGSLEADMSENHPTSSSVKWDVLLSLCIILSWMQSAGRSNVQVASVSWERLLWNQITSCTFTNTYRRTFMNHPGIWFPSQQHWFVPRHVTLWQKILLTSPVTFPLTVLTTSEEYSGSLEADMSENHPTSLCVKWDVLLSLCVILSLMQSPGRSNVQVASVSWEGLLWNQITSCTFTSTYCGTFMNDPGIWFPSQQHWSVPTYVALWQKMLPTLAVGFPLTVLTISEEYSGSLEADMSENHPTSLCVKWDVLLCLCVILSLMQSAGRSNVQVASVSWERLLWNQITSCTFTNTYRRTFMNHPGIWFPSQQHWFVPRHMTLWQKMLPILAVGFPLTVLTISEEYSGSLEADMSENHPTSSSVKWEVLPFFVEEFPGCNLKGTATGRLQMYMGKARSKLDHRLHIYKQALWNIQEAP